VTAAGDQVLAVAYSQVGVTEDPPNSNNVPYDDAWGFNSAWCATYVSWCAEQAGYPIPPINGPAGFSYCPDGQVAAFTTGHSVGEAGAEPGDTLIFSWEPFYYGTDGVAYCSSGVYAGAAAGDHTGFFVGWLGGGYMATVEGNTSQSSWDNGGAVMERTDRYTGQVCCYARHEALSGPPSGGGTQPPVEEDEDVYTALRVTSPGPWQGGVFLCAGAYAVSISDGNLLANLQARGLCKPQVVEVADFDVFGCYQVVSASGPAAMG
jgi:hypothetical protein